MAAPVWDLFCRVVDNHGDVGVCWRLAADLASRGRHVRLWIDDASALAWMAPGGCAGVDVLPWPTADAGVEPGEVVVEAFGCTLPAAFVARMAAKPGACVWLDIEYLTAETQAARSHGLASPQAHGPGAGLTKWFFFPGFVPATGGLLREPGLIARHAGFDRGAWLAAQGVAALPGERVVSLFGYAQPALPRLLQALDDEPTLLLLTPGAPTREGLAYLGPRLRRGRVRALALPYLAQSAFDALLWSCDLNLVRGEDSFVRAQWAAAPFVWQAYPQDDGAHVAKVDAFLALHLAGAEPRLRAALERLWAAWNGAEGTGRLVLPARDEWARHCRLWRSRLAAQADLTTQLLEFARQKS